MGMSHHRPLSLTNNFIGVGLDFTSLPPIKSIYSPPTSNLQKQEITNEVHNLRSLGVLIPSTQGDSLWLSPIFATGKPDGSFRLILNLKKLNAYIRHVHFKMESLSDVLNMFQKGAWMASVDLKHAYYSIPICREHQNYLTFVWQGVYYKYTCLPNGYSQAPMIFTKLLKNPFAYLRKLGHLSVIYIDDTYLQGSTFESCLQNVHATVHLLKSLGFTINVKKSVLVPTQKLEFLGFILDSVRMTLTLTDRRKLNIVDICLKLLQDKRHKIRFVAKVIGMFVAALPAVTYGALHYRALEMNKNNALRNAKGDYNKFMFLSPEAIMDVHWWHTNIHSSQHFIHAPVVNTVIHSDASLDGWGATDSTDTAGNPWKEGEDLPHINVLELYAAKLALTALAATCN